MRNQLIELAITVIVVLVIVWALVRLLPVLAVPEPWGSVMVVILGAVVVVYALRALKG